MHESMKTKLEVLKDRFETIQQILIDQSDSLDQHKIIEMNKEFVNIKPVVETYQKLLLKQHEYHDAKSLSESSDGDMKELAKEEVSIVEADIQDLEKELKFMLLPVDQDDEKSVFLEIRAGAGGDEAAIFVGDLLRMYSRLSERENWNREIISEKTAEQGGFKEVVMKISGKMVYKNLKFESGVHRVQRVPETESQGRIHTSTCTVAVLPESEEVGEINIDKSDIRIDTYRASGAGGQHVNKTDSAVRITHLPTGLVVECQDDRSQHKNKTKALSLLSAKLKRNKEKSHQAEIASERKILVGTGDRSEKIRTYNFPQGRITDHRIKLTKHNLDQAMDGEIKDICDALIAENQLQMLAQLENE